MKICGTILAVCYACIMILAVIKGKQKSISSVFIAGGSLLVFAFSFLNYLWNGQAIVLLAIGITGMSAISIGALINGIRQNHIHISHHFIRLIIEVIVIVLCAAG
ncbi:MAG: hypothetical protein K2I07_08460 [Lachnospiraceae bacterium]|nr:hypothetical protein [Lachnospiraceae bacterium]